MAKARYRVGDRIVTQLYGAGRVLTYYRDRNIGWVYHIRLDHLDRDWKREIQLVEEAMKPEPAVVQLARLAR